MVFIFLTLTVTHHYRNVTREMPPSPSESHEGLFRELAEEQGRGGRFLLVLLNGSGDPKGLGGGRRVSPRAG